MPMGVLFAHASFRNLFRIVLTIRNFTV